MKSKPRILDLFCKAGGSGMGYHRAGFEVIGVDIAPQKHYPFEFHRADAFDFAQAHGREFDLIHGSPHCQGYSLMRFVTGREYPREIERLRDLLIEIERPYVIENVAGAPLYDLPLLGSSAITLCGTMFGLKVYRHRIFESNTRLITPAHPAHLVRCAKQGRRALAGEFITVTGNCSGADYARAAMGIDWMTRDELSQAIPPAYTQFIGEQLIRAIC